MNTLQNKLRQRLTHHKINRLSIWVYVLKLFSKYYNIEEKVNWNIKNWILFVNVSSKVDKTLMFFKKRECINHINSKLTNFWYTEKIMEIIFK